ncbi:methyltransferase domain-containing protein [Streptomyces sp. TRM 70351]|uniref:methyltransferase domain-containing protein n=1 Tax=Streptomyces sp. TRM 70351 TaxID=3116552 RepID=UPI002E7BFF36|nr:methyltransferase domain-containing protein [Streptomyces sp. TRM 70351]MEE1931146.1 methyltransferase domain-containing protein [Streptomyces sp. TRM 70351]
MTATYLPQHLPRAARDWAEIQERMLVPLYEAVYDRLEVGQHTRLLGLGCGSGLALLLAGGRGAEVTGVDTDEQRLALARARLLDEPQWGGKPLDVRLAHGDPAGADAARGRPYTLVTAFDARPDAGTLAAAARRAERGAAVVLADWGPAERCAAAPALRVAARLAEPPHHSACWQPRGRDDLEELARQAGLRPDGSGRVSCPFGYADLDSAVRGLLSTGFYAAAVRATDEAQVGKELAEALHPHLRPDGTVWLPNLFRYVIARV